MKIQACSKIITLTTLGFALIAGGAFYTIQQAEQSLIDNRATTLKTSLHSLDKTLDQYIKQINHDYYELVDDSLYNILTLEENIFRRDPLLSFYHQNIRSLSAYRYGDNLRYALEELTYFKLPVVECDLNTNHIIVKGTNSQAEDNRILQAHDNAGVTLNTMIQERPNQDNGFVIMYSGNTTYLCLRIYDHTTNRHYFVIDSYLNVLDHLKLDIKNIFSDINPMLKKTLEEDAALIVRRKTPIFKTEDFNLHLPIENLNLKKLTGIRTVNENGEITTPVDYSNLSNEAHVTATGYIKSINSYLIIERKYDLVAVDDNLFSISKVSVLGASLILIVLINLLLIRQKAQVREKDLSTTKLIDRLNSINYEDYEKELKDATTAVDAYITTITQAQTKADLALIKTAKEIVNSDLGENKDNQEEQDVAQANANTDVHNINLEKSNKDNAIVNKSDDETELNKKDDEVSADESKEHDTEDSHKELDTETSYLCEKAQVLLGSLDDASSQNKLQLVDKYLTRDLLQKLKLDKDDDDARFVQAFFRLANQVDHAHKLSIENLKQDLKNRIPLYRKEGQCVAARQMLLCALPGEDEMPSSNYVDFAAVTVPAREITGNFYTLRRLNGENLAFVIGDCNSQGVKAAYTVAVVNTLIEEALAQNLAPDAMLNFLNHRMCELQNVSNVSLFVGMISEKTGNVVVSNAGHCTPIVIDNNGAHYEHDFRNDEQIKTPRLGVDADYEYKLNKWLLGNDDMVVLYTNGITNVKNNKDEAFGIKRIFDHCVDCNSLRADELVIRILNDIKQHKGKRPFKQDVSLICLKQQRTNFIS